MTDEKKEKNKWLDAVTRMIELTQRGGIRWHASDPIGSISDEENRTSAIFQADYNDRTLRLYERRVQARRPLDKEDELTTIDKFFNSAVARTYKTVWVSEIVLEFIDGKGETLWTFPKVAALSDLLAAVQYQVAGVNEFLDAIFNEPEVSRS